MIRLHRENGEPAVVNPMRVAYLEKWPGDTTCVKFDSERYVVVQEDITTVQRLLSEAFWRQ